MYTVKDASVSLSLMGQRFQPSNTSLLLDEYFTVCKLYSDTATARETHQRYVTQTENMRGILTSQSLRNSEHEAFQEANNGRAVTTAMGKVRNSSGAFRSTAVTSPNNMPSPLRTRAVSVCKREDENERAPQHASLDKQAATALDKNDDENELVNKFPEATTPPRHRLSPALLVKEEREPSSSPLEGQHDGGAGRRAQASPYVSTMSRPPSAAVEGNTRSAASYAILRKEWGHENYEEQFHKPWNAFLCEMSSVMAKVVTAWVSDLDECTPYSQNLLRLSSTCCYDAAHGMCLLRWNTMREIRAYVDALHAVVNAPLSAFFVPLTLGMQVLGVPVLCMSLAPVTGPWQGWDTVTMVWHSFCGLCANLRLMRPLDRAEGGRSESGQGPLLDGLAGRGGPSATTASALHTTVGAAGSGNALERSVAWSLLRQLEPATSVNEYYSSRGGTTASLSGYDTGSRAYGSGAAPSWESRRHSVFRGGPTTLASSASGMVDRVSRQVFASAAAGKSGSFARCGGLQLTPAIGADARWYFIDARAICLYQWYARTSWMAARVPRREMFQSENGCAQRSIGPNKLILQSKLRIIVKQLLNGLLRFNSGNSNGSFASSGMHTGVLQNGSLGSVGDGGASPRYGSRGKPPVLLSTLCHSHGVRYGSYVYAIVDLLRTDEASLDEAVQTAYRRGSSAPNKYELLKQCRRCIQAVVGELLARVIKHLIYQEWYMVIRQSPDWLHRFHRLCVAAAEAEAMAAFVVDRTKESVSPSKTKKKAQSSTLTEIAPPLSTSPAPTAVTEAANDNSGHSNSKEKCESLSTAQTEGESATTLLKDAESVPSETVVVGDEEEQEGKGHDETAVAEGIRDVEVIADFKEEVEDESSEVSAVLKHRRLLAFMDDTMEALGVPLLEVMRRVLDGVFTVNTNNGSAVASTSLGSTSAAENGGTGSLETPSAYSSSSVAGDSVEKPNSALTPPLSGGGGASVSITECGNRFMTDEASRFLATSSAQALGGYPVFNQQLSAVAFRPNMFEELLHAVNEQYVVQPYNGNEKLSEWQLLHMHTPFVVQRRQYARGAPPAGSSGSSRGSSNNRSGVPLGSGSVGGSGNNSSSNNKAGGGGSSNENGGAASESWLNYGANRSGLGSASSSSAAASPAPKRTHSASSRLHGTIPVHYPAADEESIQMEAKELFPGWSLQCLEEMIGVPLVLRQNRVDVDSSFTGADVLRALAPSLSSSAAAALSSSSSEAFAEGQVRTAGGALIVRPPLSSGSPLRSAVWGATLELPLCLHSGSVVGALEYAQHQREIGIAVISSSLSAPFIGSDRSGTAFTFCQQRIPHMVYMGKLIQLHATDVRIACRGWPIMEDFDFIKQSCQPNGRILSGAFGNRLAGPRRRGLESPLAHRQRVAHIRVSTATDPMMSNGGGGGELSVINIDSEDTLAAKSLNASMYARLSLLNARVDVHEAMSSMWRLTECIESMNGGNAAYGYLLRQKIRIIAIIAAQFAATGVTTALEAAIADLDVLTGGIFNFSSVDHLSGRKSSRALVRSSANDDVAASGLDRCVVRSPGRPFLRPALANSSNSNADPRVRASTASSASLPPRTGESTTDALSAILRTPLESQASTLDPSPQTSTATLSATCYAVAALELANPPSVSTPPLGTDASASGLSMTATAATRTLSSSNGVDATSLVVGGNLGTFKNFILRSIQCVDLYTTLLELLTQHMLLPNADRSPKESLSRAVMFCSLRRELIVMTHGENSVEAAMAANDVGLLLQQNPKTWPQAMTEFCRARQSITYHLREEVEGGVGEGEGGTGGRLLADRQLTASALNLNPSMLGAQLDSSLIVHDSRGGVSTSDFGRLPDIHVPSMALPNTRPLSVRGRHGAALSFDDAFNFVVAYPQRKGGAHNARALMRRVLCATTSDRLKQALCSILNNIAYLVCRQAQRQYVVHQQSMVAYVRNARRQDTLQKPSTGMQLRERRRRSAAKVEKLLNEAATTLQGLLSRASDIPAYDYAVALNNQACVLLHRYQYTAAKRLLLQSLRITMQLQSLSLAPVTLPVCLVSTPGSIEVGSVLWLLDPAQLPLVVAGGRGDNEKKSAFPEGNVSGARDLCTTTTAAAAFATTSTVEGQSNASPAMIKCLQGNTNSFTRRRTTRAAHIVPNALSTIAAMLEELGASLIEEHDVHGYYYYASSFPLEHLSKDALCRHTASSSAAAAIHPTMAPTSSFPSSPPSPITFSSAEQLHNCQVHTLRMLYQLELKKSFIDRLRLQQLFSRYLASWRARRQQQKEKAAKELYRFGVAAMTRVYLARRYRFSGYHWWLRQPREIRRHLDPLLDQQSLTTRRQLWDVWNVQVERSTLLLQRVLRGSVVRVELAAQYQFQQFYFLRCRPAVEAVVWQKMNVLYTSVFLHLHLQDGLRGMSTFKEAVQSGAMWMSRVTDPLRAQQQAARIGVELKELQRRETLERNFYKTLFRKRLNQLQVVQVKKSVLFAIRSPRPLFSAFVHAEQGGMSAAASPLLLNPPRATAMMDRQKKGDEPLPHFSAVAFAEQKGSPSKAADTHPKQMDTTSTTERQTPLPLETVPGGSVKLMKSPLSRHLEVPRNSSSGLIGLEYVSPTAFGGNTATESHPTTLISPAITSMASSPRPFVLPSPSAQLSSPLSPTRSFPCGSRTRRARQVIIQADAEVALTPRTTAAKEERQRQISRQCREDERAKMTQLLKQHLDGEDGWGDEGGKGGLDICSGEGNAGSSNKEEEKAEEEEKSSPRDSSSGNLITPGTEDANTKWRQALQRVGEPRASFRSDNLSDRCSYSYDVSLSPMASSRGNRENGQGVLAPALQPFSPLTPNSPTVPKPLSGPSSTPFRVASATAEAQRHQLLHASQLLLQFWWSKRAVPTFVKSAVEMHRLYNEHCFVVHVWRLQGLELFFQTRQLMAVEQDERYYLWQSEALEVASLLLLQVHSARWCRGKDAHVRWLATAMTTEERQHRVAVFLAAAARERQELPPLH